jgi:glycosyltransferase involved in cell wall biosynthesis
MDASGDVDSLATMAPELTRPTPGRRPRVLFVGSSEFDLPLTPALAKKWDAVSREMDVRVIGRAHAVRSADPRFRLIRQVPRPLRSLAYYASLSAIVVIELRRFVPDVIVTKSPYEAFVVLPARRLAHRRPKLLVDLHGDWRTAARVYGSPLRRLYARAADGAAAIALRHADGTRTLSAYTTALAGEATGRRPLAVFPAYYDLESFAASPPAPLPVQQAVAWIGVLQPYKDPGLLASAWRLMAERVPDARLVIVGQGPLERLVDELVREFPGRVTRIPALTSREIADLLDRSTVLAMSSAGEGLPRVIMEALARGRPVVAPAVGGIGDLIEPGRNGLLVPPGDAHALAAALARILTEPELAQRLSRGAVQSAEQLRWTPDRYAAALRELIETALRH